MPEVLQYLMNQVDDQFKRQIQYILEQLNNQHGKKEGEGESDMFREGEDNDLNEREDDMKSYNGGAGDQDLEDDEDEEDDEDDILEEDDGEFNDIIDE